MVPLRVVFLALAGLANGCEPPPVVPEAPAVDPDEARRQAEALYLSPTGASSTAPSSGDGPASAAPSTDTPAPQAAGSPQAEVGSAGGARIDADPVQVVLVWDGISHLHQSFFADPDIVTSLSAGLTGEVRGPANVYVRYDATNFRGSVRLQVLPDTLVRKPRRTGDALLLQDLAPITVALARYRSDVASQKDLRIESFKVGIESFRGPRACIFEVAGRPPPDGRLVSPCVEINGKQQCGSPTPEGVRFPADVAADIATCLDL